jgi:hypothetical protein
MLCVAAALAGGCNRGPAGPKLVPVHGTITLDGKPLSGAAIRFVPIGNTQGSGASGCADKDGKYEVFDRRGDKGAPVGEYNVSIVKPVGPGGSSISSARGGAAVLMDSSRIVVQKATVPEGGCTVDFPLKSKP